jgi:hypothetical protein
MCCLADYLSIAFAVLPGVNTKINSGLASQMYYKEFNKQNRNCRVISHFIALSAKIIVKRINFTNRFQGPKPLFMQKKLLTFGCILAMLTATLIARAQYTNVMISDEYYPEETSIFINPKNTKQIIAGANLNSFYFSFDGGQTWTRNPMNSTLGVYGDPCVIIDTNGYFYFFHLSYPSNETWLDQIVCQRSTNNGLSWNNGSGIGKNDPKQQDKEWAIVNRQNNEIYVTWTQFDSYGSTNPERESNIMFSKSADEGITWSDAIEINEIPGNCIDSDSTVEGAVPAVGPNGEIYTAWAGPAGLVFDRSLDGGLSWLDTDIFVSDIPGGWDYSVPGIYRANGLPVTCSDISKGPNRGNIYINWTDERSSAGAEQDLDVWLVKSTDGGNTWSAPKRVNDDGPGKQQFFTWMTVDQVTGYLWFVFYDRRNYDDTRTDVFMAVSKDGGETFENFIISESPFIPNPNVFFGDYTGISAHNNVVRPIWTRLDEFNLSVWTALLDSYFTGIKKEEAIPFAIEEVYPNPFSESTAFSFKLRVPSVINLSVYNQFGQKITDLIENKMLQPGKYVEHFDPGKFNLPSGVYYFSLSGNGINKHRKIVYEK